MKFLHTDTGFQAVADDGRPVCVIDAKAAAVPARAPGMGVPAQAAVPEKVRPQAAWTFEFVGRPITQAELLELAAKLPGVEKMADGERKK